MEALFVYASNERCFYSLHGLKNPVVKLHGIRYIHMDINSLSGKDLDRYGESLGITRYQGLGLPEDDDSYRKAIFNKLGVSTKRITDKFISASASAGERIYHLDNGRDALYAVCIKRRDNGEIVGLKRHLRSTIAMAIYNSWDEAENAARMWEAEQPKINYIYDVFEVKIFT